MDERKPPLKLPVFGASNSASSGSRSGASSERPTENRATKMVSPAAAS